MGRSACRRALPQARCSRAHRSRSAPPPAARRPEKRRRMTTGQWRAAGCAAAGCLQKRPRCAARARPPPIRCPGPLRPVPERAAHACGASESARLAGPLVCASCTQVLATGTRHCPLPPRKAPRIMIRRTQHTDGRAANTVPWRPAWLRRTQRRHLSIGRRPSSPARLRPSPHRIRYSDRDRPRLNWTASADTSAFPCAS